MRTAYLDCSSGISGDMTVAALVDAGVDLGALRAGISSLGLPDVSISIEAVVRCGFRASHLRIEHPEQHAHRHYRDICRIIDNAAALTDRQRGLARRIFEAIGNAEARVHGSTLDKIHFHEVGAVDSIVDIVATAIGFDLLAVDDVVASPVPTGRGKVMIAHGVCAVPTPGTAELLKGIPLVDVPVDFELTTPTGAAILKTIVTRFGPLPAMTIESIGYGAGTKDFPDRANLLRIVVGTTSDAASDDQVWLLETNLDDIPGEVIGYTKQRLLAAGALDVYSTGIQMKKDRPGTLLSVLCGLGDRERMESILFAETATFGIRRQLVQRSKRIRREHFVETAWGRVQGKLGRFGGDVVFTPEHDSCASLATRFNVPLRTIGEAAIDAYRKAPVAAESVTPASEMQKAPVIGTSTITPMITVTITPTITIIIIKGPAGMGELLSGNQVTVLGLMLVVMAILVRRATSRARRSSRNPLQDVKTAFASIEQSTPGRALQAEVHLHEVARKVEARIETRMLVLDQMILSADREIRRLQDKLKELAGPNASFSDGSSPVSGAGALGQMILALAARGMSPEVIAEMTCQPIARVIALIEAARPIDRRDAA